MIISRRRRRFCINSIVALLLVYYYSYIAFSNDGAASNSNNEVRLASSAVVNVTGSSYYDEQLKTKQQALPPPAAYQVTNSFCYNCKWPGSETSCMERVVFLRKRNNMGLHEAIASARDAGCTTKSNSDYIKDAYKMMNNKTILSEFSKIYSFCGDCNWKVGTGQSCLERAVFLQKKYNVALNVGIASAMEKPSCRKSKSGHNINDTLHEYVSDEKKYQHQSHNTSLVMLNSAELRTGSDRTRLTQQDRDAWLSIGTDSRKLLLRCLLENDEGSSAASSMPSAPHQQNVRQHTQPRGQRRFHQRNQRTVRLADQFAPVEEHDDDFISDDVEPNDSPQSNATDLQVNTTRLVPDGSDLGSPLIDPGANRNVD